ncbi:MAG TPA: MurT ligase domain-containing protein [Actinomycetota bacterium]|nr:MurT ligase domain-containing protein [Actinomycetota bacterium]
MEALETHVAFEERLRSAREELSAEAGTRRADGTTVGARLLEDVPDALARLAARLPEGVVLVSGTNGKTTTTRMIAAVLEAAGLRPVSNRIGSNQAGGIAAELVDASGSDGGMRGTIGVFEVDELWLERVIDDLAPRVVVLTNLFRDQLDRLGEIDIVASRWGRVASSASPGTRFVLCADDPRVAHLPVTDPDWFGIEDDGGAMTSLPNAADPMSCPDCGSLHGYAAIHLGHLGRWSCATCGIERPAPHVAAVRVDTGAEGPRFELRTPEGSAQVGLRIPGSFNVYNALAAASAARALRIPPSDTAAALSAITPAFGRGERVRVGAASLTLFLAKNPTGLDEVLRALPLGAVHVLSLLNDSVYDGRDVSWIWDADLEQVADRAALIVCGGTRAADLALRWRYAGVPASRIRVAGSVEDALDRATERSSEISVIASYTAMLDVRDVLAERGWVESVWR